MKSKEDRKRLVLEFTLLDEDIKQATDFIRPGELARYLRAAIRFYWTKPELERRIADLETQVRTLEAQVAFSKDILSSGEPRRSVTREQPVVSVSHDWKL